MAFNTYQYEFAGGDRTEKVLTIDFANVYPFQNVNKVSFFKEDDVTGTFQSKQFRYSFDNVVWSNWATLTQAGVQGIPINDNPNLYLHFQYSRNNIGSANIRTLYILYETDVALAGTPEDPSIDADYLGGQPPSYYLDRANFFGTEGSVGYFVENVDGSGVGVYDSTQDTSIGTSETTFFFKRINDSSDIFVTDTSGIITLDVSIVLTDASVADLYGRVEVIDGSIIYLNDYDAIQDASIMNFSVIDGYDKPSSASVRVYNNNEANAPLYGRLYEEADAWLAVPDGWRIPLEAEILGLLASDDVSLGGRWTGSVYENKDIWINAWAVNDSDPADLNIFYSQAGGAGEGTWAGLPGYAITLILVKIEDDGRGGGEVIIETINGDNYITKKRLDGLIWTLQGYQGLLQNSQRRLILTPGQATEWIDDDVVAHTHPKSDILLLRDDSYVEDIGNYTPSNVYKFINLLDNDTGVFNTRAYDLNAIKATVPTGYRLPTSSDLQNLLVTSGQTYPGINSNFSWDVSAWEALFDGGSTGFDLKLEGYFALLHWDDFDPPLDQTRIWNKSIKPNEITFYTTGVTELAWDGGTDSWFYMVSPITFPGNSLSEIINNYVTGNVAGVVRFIKEDGSLGGGTDTINGTVYNLVDIGGTIWMAENYIGDVTAEPTKLIKKVNSVETWANDSIPSSYDAIQDASILSLDSSVYESRYYDWVWSDGSAGGGDTYMDFTIVDASAGEITVAFASILFVNKVLQTNNFSIQTNVVTNDTIRILDSSFGSQDPSTNVDLYYNRSGITISEDQIVQLDASIVRIDAYNIIQDISILNSNSVPIIEMSDVNISIDSSWNNYFIKLNPATDASVSFDQTTEGVNLTFENESANTIYFYSGSGAPVLKSKDSAVTCADQYGMVTAIHDSSSWYLSGDLS